MYKMEEEDSPFVKVAKRVIEENKDLFEMLKELDRTGKLRRVR